MFRNVIKNLHVYLIIKINDKFSPFRTTKTSSREILVEFKQYHLIQ